MAVTTTTKKPTQRPATPRSARKGQRMRESAFTASPVISAHPAITTAPRLRFCFAPDTVGRFFDKTQRKQIPVTVHRRCGKVHVDVLPIERTETGYVFKNGRRFEVGASEIVRFEYTAQGGQS